MELGILLGDGGGDVVPVVPVGGVRIVRVAVGVTGFCAVPVASLAHENFGALGGCLLAWKGLVLEERLDCCVARGGVICVSCVSHNSVWAGCFIMLRSTRSDVIDTGLSKLLPLTRI